MMISDDVSDDVSLYFVSGKAAELVQISSHSSSKELNFVSWKFQSSTHICGAT